MMKKFFTQLYQIWITERPNQLAAALAYFGMFSFAPIIFIALSIMGLFVDQIDAADQLYLRVESVLGPEVANLVRDAVTALSNTSSAGSIWITIISFLALLFAASGLFFQLQYALNTIWHVPPPQKGQTTAFLRQRLFSFVMVIGVGLVGILAIFANLLLGWFGSFLEKLLRIDGNQVLAARVITLIVVTVSFALLYKILPQAKVGWRDVWLGAIVASVLIVAIMIIAGLFFQNSSISSALAATGAFTVLLISFYYVAQIFLLGALCCRVYAGLYGSQRSSLAEQEKV